MTTTENRILTRLGSTLDLAPGSSAILVYDGTDARWRVVASHVTAASLGGGGAGYKVARGMASIRGSGTVVTGLATVVAVTATSQEDLDGETLAGVSATIGDQAGAPAAGSVVLKTWKFATGGAARNPTLVPATAAKRVNWIAIGPS